MIEHVADKSARITSELYGETPSIGGGRRQQQQLAACKLAKATEGTRRLSRTRRRNDTVPGSPQKPSSIERSIFGGDIGVGDKGWLDLAPVAVRPEGGGTPCSFRDLSRSSVSVSLP
ncbi:hypothetical protein GWI33_003575 [Rhynchophorus ferrugineus]|uniref:Uncharacterized protein n=1 Tax=Rhynchophorus ferrugineus TaxID=354439 RepID=A0A834HJ88_RHYFE|nr:hypothetical protein GWI33_003575 [Rhynchophorus ferrugineus]